MTTSKQIKRYIQDNVKNATDDVINNMLDRFELKMVVGKIYKNGLGRIDVVNSSLEVVFSFTSDDVEPSCCVEGEDFYEYLG